MFVKDSQGKKKVINQNDGGKSGGYDSRHF